jgi:Transmembrane protein 65
MDNIVMIQAGEAIDMSLGVAFGLSTLTAAGFGQCVSDVAGFTCGGIVDAGVSKLNLPHHNLSPAQLDLKVTRTWHTFGGCVGVVMGCLLGMTCLLFMDTDRADRAKKAKELQSIFESILVDGKTLINAGKFDQASTSAGTVIFSCATKLPSASMHLPHFISILPASPWVDRRTSHLVDAGRMLQNEP